jgi:hypothetical protein
VETLAVPLLKTKHIPVSNLPNCEGSVNGPKFGVVSATGPAREIQFALKFLF